MHLVCDNYATHKHPTIQEWLEKHPCFHIHFTPTPASWLNMVERLFRSIRPAVLVLVMVPFMLIGGFFVVLRSRASSLSVCCSGIHHRSRNFGAVQNGVTMAKQVLEFLRRGAPMKRPLAKVVWPVKAYRHDYIDSWVWIDAGRYFAWHWIGGATPVCRSHCRRHCQCYAVYAFTVTCLARAFRRGAKQSGLEQLGFRQNAILQEI